MRSEFAVVGFSGVPTITADLVPVPLSDTEANALLKERSLSEFTSFASGRQNVAFLDVNLKLVKRFNPLLNLAEQISGYFLDSFDMPHDTAEIILYPFDGKEALVVPQVPGATELRAKDGKSTYDNFVFAIVNKSGMQKVRDDRYDVSITTTKDHAKLPVWATVMTENAEITETLLTPEFIKAVETAGDLLDYVIVSDQSNEKPKMSANTTEYV